MDITPNLLLSLIIGALGGTGMLIAARNPILGWSISIGLQPFWYTYYLLTGGYFLVALSTLYLYAGIKNLRAALAARGLTLADYPAVARAALTRRRPAPAAPARRNS